MQHTRNNTSNNGGLAAAAPASSSSASAAAAAAAQSASSHLVSVHDQPVFSIGTDRIAATPEAKLRPWAPFHLHAVEPPLYGMLRATSRLLLQAAAAALKAVAQEGGSGKQGCQKKFKKPIKKKRLKDNIKMVIINK